MNSHGHVPRSNLKEGDSVTPPTAPPVLCVWCKQREADSALQAFCSTSLIFCSKECQRSHIDACDPCFRKILATRSYPG